MDDDTSVAHSFVVRLWREFYSAESDRVIWRGHITHVASGERRYIQDLLEIPPFIAAYLEPWDSPPALSTRFRVWLRRLWRHLR